MGGQRVAQAGAAPEAGDDLGGVVAIQGPAGAGDKQRPVGLLGQEGVEGLGARGGEGQLLAASALARYPHGAMAACGGHIAGGEAQGFADAQAQVGEQVGQGAIARGGLVGGAKQRAGLVAVGPQGLGVLTDVGTIDVLDGVAIDELLGAG